VTAATFQQVTPDQVPFRDAAATQAVKALRFAFDFAQNDATLLQPATAPSTAGALGAQNARLTQASAAVAARIAGLNQQLADLNRRAATAPAASQPIIAAQRDRITAELKLATMRNQVLSEYSEFMSGQQNADSASILSQIKDQEKSIPELSPDSEKAAAVAPSEPFRADSVGVIGLIDRMFTLSGQLSDLRSLISDTDHLRGSNEVLRTPLRAQLTEAIHRGDSMAEPHPSTEPLVLTRQTQEFNALSDQFKNLSDAVVPLSEQGVLLDESRANLVQWQVALDREFGYLLRRLLWRLAIMGAAIIAILGMSVLWRRATFRYVGDVRRRRQFLLMRRVVIGVIIAMILVGGLVTQFGSLATYAGILTAGIAVSLQTVILSAVAYFFFIGRYGVRVGDRVTVGGVTGDVIDIGLFRLYLMELGGGQDTLQPTGRIVVFSNSVLFQPSGFYKQLPGSDYNWHEVALTLAPESDYKLAEQRLLTAVGAVVNPYLPDVQKQHEIVNQSVHVPTPTPQISGQFHFVESGLEYVVRYPVQTHRTAEIDDQITRHLLTVIDEEPKLKLVNSSPPKIQPAG
jgi:small-conductance mechanosensitive channel